MNRKKSNLTIDKLSERSLRRIFCKRQRLRGNSDMNEEDLVPPDVPEEGNYQRLFYNNKKKLLFFLNTVFSMAH